MHPRWILWVYSAVDNSVSDTERGFFCGYCLLQEAKMLRWVSECNNRLLILIQVWSGVSQCYLLFIYEYLSSSTFALDTQLSSALLWFLAYSHQSIVFSSCRDTTEDNRRQWTSHNHFRIVAIKNISFPCRNILIGVIGASWNSEKTFFHFKREQFTV